MANPNSQEKYDFASQLDLDRIVDRFKQAWRQGTFPDWLTFVPKDFAPSQQLVLELVRIDYQYRLKAGQLPQVTDYWNRLPSHRASLEELFKQLLNFDHATLALDATPFETIPADHHSDIPRDVNRIPVNEASKHSVIDSIGDYDILHEIARGGMGIVYKAMHRKLGRLAAIKVIVNAEFASEQQVKRFHMEAEAAARLDHIGIVPVFEVGQHAGRPFLAMAFVDGASLWEKVKEKPLQPQEAARIIRDVASAIQHAHDRGILHRDLKPQNILISSVDNQPKITDFGLARRTTDHTGLTVTGQVMGTPSYMPPEQASGRMREVGVTADVYSLGATLYCLLTGRPPFQAASWTETLRQVVEQDPIPPRILDAGIPADLSMICLKCLEKSSGLRYSSAQGLTDDLDCFLRGDAISVSSIHPMDRVWRTLGRHRDDAELKTWGELLYYFAPIVLITELVISQLGQHDVKLSHAYGWAGLVRVFQLAAMGAVAWLTRSKWMNTWHSAARLMWSQWAAFLIACHLAVFVKVIYETTVPNSPAISLFNCYPYFAIFSGILWFTLGSNFWGTCYLFGAMFFLMSMLLPFCPTWGPLLFGATWAALLVITGRRLQRLS